jgi:PAS domain S-box-containing protein
MSFSARDAAYDNLYQRLLWWRRFLIVVIILAGYGFYLLLETNQGLVQLGLISFVAVVQFLPGIVGLLFWSRATRAGFIGGLLGGGFVWAFTLLVPLLEHSGITHSGFNLQDWLGGAGEEPIVFGTFWSLAVNSLLFVGLSVWTRQTAEEMEAARACVREALPPRGVVEAESPQQFRDQLARVVGVQTAEREVHQALTDLELNDAERRPTQLRRLRERIERNLSGLIGPLLARMVVNDRLRLDQRSQLALADTVRFLEEHLEDSRSRLQGLAAELDALRRYHRQIMQELPLAACSLGPEREVVIWNHAMERLSGLTGREAGSVGIGYLPPPWGALLRGFADAQEQHLYKLQVHIRGRARWFNLHKAAIEDPNPLARVRSGMVILVEDLTERQMLESELAHADRLASIGRLAAGVAHEIGNPLTGIASLAQNLRDEQDAGVLEESIGQIQQQIRRIADIVQSLVTFAHGGVPSERPAAPVALAACVEEAVRLVQLSHAGKQIRFVNDCDPDVVLQGDRSRMVQLFVNLLSNACDASRPGDAVEVVSVLEREDIVHIEVRDAGTGIPDELRERVFEPFFTTKQPGEGTGLGLPLVYNIVSDHGGVIAIESTTGVGTTVIVRLPREREFGISPPPATRVGMP